MISLISKYTTPTQRIIIILLKWSTSDVKKIINCDLNLKPSLKYVHRLLLRHVIVYYFDNKQDNQRQSNRTLK